ncbi:ABC transporter permease [Cellulomonas fimi]|uniref:Binding-protein-dependent transport systems inner membrane component n=1 Tax=Cellulomonas fimi (strain ATCC 484 / DSM 20113 / JCM 1341 / CCUG 24087 / LMG 16345 / NBRC 15513 / NCIMB 8980 / NCTC 7547 / NRS-133) TaxID=590998 RepID=F4H854_CELFA|nr:ABC transporter permease [Cellulomonas fimi]AEE44611.1 binding-protein-dependent transport systems inner membrane component [Cellulomonas fimi ATCC 484]NNH08790.1 ABC transporter permease [Cellulomonas fimi]VEH26778.1 Glutathione transport system permease protein gsiC [Cellulomonas fimi]
MRFFVRRGIFYVVTAWAAVTINFIIPRLMPGDPVKAIMAKSQGKLDSSAEAAIRTLFGLDEDKSVWQQYLDYWNLLLHGNLGVSFTYYPTPVAEMIQQTLPWTVGLVGIATVVAFLVGTLVGTGIGWRRGTWADSLLPISTFFSAVPYFWLGLVVIAIFSVNLGWFPSSGAYDRSMVPAFTPEFIGSVLYYGTLPALTIVISSIAGWILGMRNMMVTVSSEDYVTVAQAKGLSERAVVFGYAARNAVLPQISSFALSLGFIVGGTLIMEMVFSYPGIGFLLYNATTNHDYTLMQGCFLVITLSVLVANVVADFVYAVLDPRTRQEG